MWIMRFLVKRTNIKNRESKLKQKEVYLPSDLIN